VKNTFFVTGTDTGVGKTLITGALLHLAAQKGLRAYGLKPIAAGCTDTPEGLKNEDALLLQSHSNIKLPYSQINPVALRAAKAPHIAAAEEGRRLSLDRIVGLCRGALMQPADLRLIEGAGGWRVPLNDYEFLSGLPLQLQTPVILVVGLRLGCLNHALLTAEAIQRDGLPLAGWVANGIDPQMDSVEENLTALRRSIPAPCLGVVPALDEVSVERVVRYLDLDGLFKEAKRGALCSKGEVGSS
jgi:dethiobiotin synthetase